MPDIELSLENMAKERERCRVSFSHFLSHCKIVEVPTRDNPGGLIPFAIWPHLPELINALLNKLLIVVIKSRQIGLSWLIAAYVLWHALYHKGSSWMLFSRGEREAIELLDKSRRIYRHLPAWLTVKHGADSATEMSFPFMESSIKAFAATEGAGISYTSSGVVCDEWDYHPYADQNYLNSKPTRDAGGQFIGVTTVDILNPDTLAKSIFHDASIEKNDFIPLFYSYDVRPGRDDKWYEETRRNIPERELATLTPELYMAQNYPRSIEEALSVPQASCAFDKQILSQMMENIRNPVKVEGDLDFGVVNIYKPFLIGNYYIAGTDTSHGVGKDYSVTAVMNVKTGEIVADILRNDLSPEELASHSVKLLKLYGNPKWFIECNDWGGITISTAESLEYKNLGYQDDKKTKPGFNTNGWMTSAGLKGSRIDLFGGLIPAINNNQIIIYNKDGLKQFYDVIRNVKQGGRIEALAGRHDDYPIAVGICWAKRDEVHLEDWTPKTINTLNYQPTSKPWRR